MKKTIFILTILISSFSYCQNNELWDVMKLPKVIINKKYTSYTISYSTIENGIKNELKYNKLSIDDPFFLTIISDEEGGKLKITNPKMPEDIVVNFKAIYKDKDNGKTVYHFSTNDRRYNIHFFIDNETNDSIILSFDKDKENSITYIYTLANTQ